MEERQQKLRANRSTVLQRNSSLLQALFLLLIYFRVGSADSEGSGPDDTGPVGTDLVVIVDTGPTGSGLRDLDSVDTGPTGSADTGLADIGLADSGPAGTGLVHPGPADTGPADLGSADTGPADTGPA